HFVLPQFGESAQQKLLQSRVAVVGAGGLGCPVLQYLVAAGVGHISIFDHDNVSLSNLQRQILYTATDLNQPKAQVAAEKLRALNQHVQIDSFVNQLNTSNTLGLLKGFQLIIDCTDNFPTRYLLND
ncbi:MAG: HesA/MoeB/ThiF family protein, partial [Flammeovirgaceae bacterium]